MIEKLGNNKKYIVFIGFSICMVVFGASDSLRGIFSMVFQESYQLNTTQLSLIVTMSYLGNLVFLLCGGNLLDRFNKKNVFLVTLGIWMIGAVLFITGDYYILLLIGMFLCTGASTLMNTTINILVPVIFISTPGLIVNILFFIQGIGTSGAQNVVGRFAIDIINWKLVNLILLGIAVVGMIIMFSARIPNVSRKKETISYKHIIKNPAFVYYILVFGFYFVAEHGILNWFMVYGVSGLGLEKAHVAVLLSIFFGGITVGRLVFAPLVERIGIEKSIIVFASIGTILYVIGIAGGIKTVVVLSSAGLALSILYPTLVLMIRNYFGRECIASATGVIISVATVFDIVFNLVFGKIADLIGMRTSFYILQVSMMLFLCSLMLFQRKKLDSKEETKY